MSRRTLAVAGALLALLALPAAASAHATLESTTPARGAVVQAEPPAVVFRFSETVEGNFGAVRVFDAKGVRVDKGDAYHPGGEGSALAVHLEPGLAKGTYTATYRVVSADSHVVSSGVVFSVGRTTAAGATVAQLLGRSRTGPATQVAFGAARALQYAAIGAGVGLLAFLVLVWLPAMTSVAGGGAAWLAASVAFVSRLRRVLTIVALLGAASALAAVVLEAASAAGITFWAALKPSILQEVLGTKFGTLWTAAAAAWFLIGGLAQARLSGAARRAPVLQPASVGATGLALPAAGTRSVLAFLLPAAFLVMVPALAGHGTTQSPVAVMLPANIVHVASMALWVGGLTALLLVLPAATRELQGADRTRLLSAALLRFSPLALGAVGVLLATGLVQSFVEIRHVSLIFDTPFGRAAFIKLCLLLVLLGFGAMNRRATLPRLAHAAAAGETPGGAGIVLRRTLRGELALLVAVFAVTGALASYAPAIAQVSGPVAVTKNIGPKELQLTVDPATAGPNVMHLYLVDPRSGAQFDGVEQLTVQATQTAKGIGPLDLQAQKTGPGHYTIAGAPLNAPGTWKLAVTMRVSEFDEFTTTANVDIR
ncbi:MAG: copper transport protein [Solirubrobacteraceae bacterium]|nr:copper transport protein [Solirubrobacteraceae bacterium]